MNSLKEVGLYIHIPFCLKKCDYCDFYSIDNFDENIQNKYVDAIINEIKSYNDKLKDYTVKTIYFGGGTPSTLSVQNITRILEKIYVFNITENAEVTIELNPETLSYTYLQELYKTKINRISIGMQSLSNKFLKQIGRIHTKEKFLEQFDNAKKVGFTNINVDIMYGFYNQTIEDLTDTLDELINLNPTHISAYSLILEENTKMFDDFENGKISEIDEDLERKMYYIVTDTLEENGYNRYEISNYAKEGYESKHNSSYWQDISYIGFGCSATSYFENFRYKNPPNVLDYIDKNGIVENIEIEEVTKENKIEEYFFLGLRMKKGVSYSDFYKKFNVEIDSIFKNEIDKLIIDGLIEKNGDTLKLTNKGFDLSNYVLSNFILC